jgi:hypothetical protein
MLPIRLQILLFDSFLVVIRDMRGIDSDGMDDPYHPILSGNKALRPRKLVLLLGGIGTIVYVMSGRPMEWRF